MKANVNVKMVKVLASILRKGSAMNAKYPFLEKGFNILESGFSRISNMLTTETTAIGKGLRDLISGEDIDRDAFRKDVVELLDIVVDIFLAEDVDTIKKENRIYRESEKVSSLKFMSEFEEEKIRQS